MKKGQLKSLLIVILFVLAITLPIATIEWEGGNYSETEKRLLAPFPVIIQMDGSINQNLGGELKAWLEDHIGFREEFVLLSGKMKLNLFNQSPSEQVHIGSDGWYYYTGDSNLEIASGQYPLQKDTLEAILQNHLAIRDKLEKQNIEYVIVLPVSKVSIYPEYMRVGPGQVRETPVDVVANYLETNSDLNVVRLKDALLNAKETAQVFFKTDTHWNQYGSYIAYRKIIEKLSSIGLCDSSLEEVSFEVNEYQGEFAAMMGSEDFIPPEETWNSVIINKNAIKDECSERYSLISNSIRQEGIHNPCYFYTNDTINEMRCLMYGDSMFGSWNATELLAEHFSELTYVWDYNIRDSIVEAVQPDVLIYEMTERYLNIFPSKNSSFLKEPLQDHQAQILSCRMDGNILKILAKNNSSSKWQFRDQIRCCIWKDGVDVGYRAEIPADVVVNPGDTIEFQFDCLESLVGATIEVQMLQEGITYFGDRKMLTQNSLSSIILR